MFSFISGGIAAATKANIVIKRLINGEEPLDAISSLTTASINTPVKEFFTTNEAMKVLGMSKPTILKKIKKGLIPYEGSIGRGGFVIHREELKAYAEKNNIVPDWGVDNSQTVSDFDTADLDELIKFSKIEKEKIELELEELELEADDSVEYKRKVIQTKKKIIALDNAIQQYQIILKRALIDKMDALQQKLL